VISCELNLGLHLSQGAGFHQVCLMFARCLLDRVNGVLRMCLSLCIVYSIVLSAVGHAIRCYPRFGSTCKLVLWRLQRRTFLRQVRASNS